MSAIVRSSIGGTVSDETAKNRISPMIDEMGARIGRPACGGRLPAMSDSFSLTIWRAM